MSEQPALVEEVAQRLREEFSIKSQIKRVHVHTAWKAGSDLNGVVEMTRCTRLRNWSASLSLLTSLTM